VQLLSNDLREGLEGLRVELSAALADGINTDRFERLRVVRIVTHIAHVASVVGSAQHARLEADL
jgi:hypothetical protein